MKLFTREDDPQLHFREGCNRSRNVINVPAHIASKSKLCKKCNPDFVEPVSCQPEVLIDLLVAIEKFHLEAQTTHTLYDDIFEYGDIESWCFEWQYERAITK